jgi:hypothetical protein
MARAETVLKVHRQTAALEVHRQPLPEGTEDEDLAGAVLKVQRQTVVLEVQRQPLPEGAEDEEDLTLRERKQHEEHDDANQKHDGPVLFRRTT